MTTKCRVLMERTVYVPEVRLKGMDGVSVCCRLVLLFQIGIRVACVGMLRTGWRRFVEWSGEEAEGTFLLMVVSFVTHLDVDASAEELV